MGDHFLHADGLMDFCRMEIAAEEGITIVLPKALLVHPIHRHGGVEDVEGILSRRDFRGCFDKEVCGIAPIPSGCDAVMENEIPQRDAEFRADTIDFIASREGVCGFVWSARIMRLAFRPSQMAGGP